MNTEKLAWLIRYDVLQMVHLSHASHIGSCFSVADIIAVLYGSVLKFDPHNPTDENRDRLVLSKGHAGAALYAALGEVGFFDKEMLKQYEQNGSHFSGHISHIGVPGVEFSTGSLGHGVCVATGLALAGKMDKKDYHVYAIVGDGECDEGSFWETVLFAHQYKLKNYTIVIDRNRMQALGYCKDICDTFDLAKKLSAFGWNTIKTAGNDHDALKKAFREKFNNDNPTCIIAETTKGKGVSFMENNLLWHYRDPQGVDYENAMKELEAAKK